MWWETGIVAIASTVTGGALTFASTYGLARRQDRLRRREEAARIVGAALGALRQLDPEVWGERIKLAGPERGLQLVTERWALWLAAATGLEVLVALNPGSRTAELAGVTLAKGNTVAIRLDELARLGANINEAWTTQIPIVHGEALDAARELAREIQG